jgi:Putative redox-active protein (C_GCAxxG_C_C)
VGLEKIEQEDENVIKAVGAFGGGIASSGSTCGTLLGAVAAVSALHSRGNLEGKENPRMWGIGKKIVKIFDELTEEFGGNTCRDITLLEWSDRDAVKDFYFNPDSRRKICTQLIGDLAFALGTILDKELSRLK